MVLLRILSGSKAGVSWRANRLPITIGRGSTATLQLEDEGIFEQHLRLELNTAAGLVITAQANALASINGDPVQQAILRNGDIIQAGSVKMQFLLSDARQSGLREREWLTWAALAAICLGQVALVYWLLG